VGSKGGGNSNLNVQDSLLINDQRLVRRRRRGGVMSLSPHKPACHRRTGALYVWIDPAAHQPLHLPVHHAQDDKNASRGRLTGGRVRGVPPMSIYNIRRTQERGRRGILTGEANGGEGRKASSGRCTGVCARREGTMKSVGYLPSKAILRDLDVSGTTEAGCECGNRCAR
jgi:hypothetical protein